MSYILDALKQSERRRNRQAPLVQPQAATEVPAPPAWPFYRRRGFWLLLVLLLAMPLGMVLARLAADRLELSSLTEPGSQIQSPTSAGHSPPVQKPQPTSKPVVISVSSPRILVEAPPAVSLNEPRPASAARPEAAAAASPPTPQFVEKKIPEPAFDPGVPDIRELPASIRSRLPALTLSVHIYSPDPAARMTNINGQMLREGQNLGPLSIERITPKGVVLRFQENEFHLGSVGG